jgi:hypothetical protein
MTRSPDEEPRLGASRRTQLEAARPGREPVTNRAISASACCRCLHDDLADLFPGGRKPKFRSLGGPFEAIEVGIEIVDFSVDECRGVEDAVAPVDHMVVERNHHQRRIGDDTPELARIKGRVVDGLPSAERLHPRDHVFGGENA